MLKGIPPGQCSPFPSGSHLRWRASTDSGRFVAPTVRGDDREWSEDMESAAERDPVVEAYKQHVDRTLLRENLRRTPEERVLALMALQRLAEEARHGGRAL